MATPVYPWSSFGALKRIKMSHPAPLLCRTRQAGLAQVRDQSPENAFGAVPEPPQPLSPEVARTVANLPVPRAVQAMYLRPLRRTPKYGLPVCNLQLRSYSVRNLDFYADFAMRAAYYLNLPAKGPVPLPRIVERWTVPRSNFVHKKSQENFERRTCRRLIQIQDGNPETVQLWLAYLEKRGYHGVGMKANMWEYERLDLAKRMDEEAEEMRNGMEAEFKRLNIEEGNQNQNGLRKKVDDLLGRKAHAEREKLDAPSEGPGR